MDYAIVDSNVWRNIKSKYKKIKAKSVYNLFITFSFHGLSFKNIYVSGSEIIFEVIQKLFVNKMFGIENFKQMFEVRYKNEVIDPSVSFDWFGDVK